MKRAIAIATLLALTLTLPLAGCGGSGDGAASGSSYDKKKKSALTKGKKGKKGKRKGDGAAVVAEAADAGLVLSDEVYVYDPTGKRDPFRSYILERDTKKATRGPLERFDLAQLDLAAVIWDAGQERALIRDPSGRGYIVSEGTPIGKNSGTVVEIADSVVVVEEVYENHLGERTKKNIEMRIRHSQGG